jgi:hypothetical protein
MNKRRLLFLSVILILLAFSTWWFLLRQTGGAKGAFSAIPEKPIFLYAMPSDYWPEKPWEKTLSQYGQFPLLSGVVQQLEELFSFYQAIEGTVLSPDDDVLLAGYISGNSNPDLLLVFTLSNDRKWDFEDNLGQMDSVVPQVKERLVNKRKLQEVTYPSTNKKFVAYQDGNLLIISKSAFLVETAVTSLHAGNGVVQNEAFNTLSAKMDKSDVPVFYFHVPQLASFMELASNWQVEGEGKSVHSLVEWIAFSVKQASNMLLFDGFAVSGQEGNWLLNPYLTTSSGKSELTAILPANTMFFWERLPGVSPEILMGSKSEAQSEYTAYFKSWVDGHWATAVTFTLDTGIQAKTACIIKALNTSDAFNLLSANANPLEQNYRSVIFNRMAPSGVISMLSGISDSTYFAALNDYIVFCPSLNQLKSFIDAHLSRRTLAERNSFVRADSVLLSSWNQLFFFDLAAISSVQTAADSLSRPFADQLSPLFIQLNQSNGLFIVNGYLLQNSNSKDDVLGSWIAETDAAITTGPFVLYNQLTGTDCIAVQDSLHQLYLIDANGELIWKRPLSAPIVGQIATVDFYSNQRYQMLFSTSDAIQLIDMKGNDVEGFPIRLTSPVVSGMSVIDYEQNGDYRMFVGCDNGNMYGFYRNGKPLQGWKPLKSGQLNGSLKHMVSGGMDYLYFRQTSGKLVAKNRKGEDRFSPVNVPANLLTELIPDRLVEPTALISLDQSGNLYSINLNGTTSSKPFAEDVISAAMGDIDSDGLTDVVYNSPSGVFAVNMKGEVIYTFDPGDPLAYKVSILLHGSSTKVIVSSSETGHTYLLSPQGEPAHTEPFEISGNTAWSNNPVSLFIIASNRLLQSFQIE